MKLTVWGINYAPEPTGIAPYNTDLCDYLAAQGHEVTALTSFRYYPYWERLKGDHWQLYRTDTVGIVKVIRCWCYLAKSPSSLKRIFHELSFCSLSFLRLLFMQRPDLVIVISPPLALGFFAWLATRLKRTRFIFHVQDLQPDAALGLGMLKSGFLVRSLYWLEAFAYRKAALVSSISGGIIKAFRQKGVAETKLLLFPNWLRKAPQPYAPDEGARVRQKFNIPKDCFLALYSGNIGKKQNIEILCEAGRQLCHAKLERSVCIVIAGDGAGRAALEASLLKHPTPSILLLPLLDNADYEGMLAAAQVCLITQAPGTGRYFFPSKLLSALSARVPVIALADEDSELAQSVDAGAFGKTIDAEDSEGLSRCLQALANDESVLQEWKNGTCWVDQFSRQHVLPQFEAEILRRFQKSTA